VLSGRSLIINSLGFVNGLFFMQGVGSQKNQPFDMSIKVGCYTLLR